MLMSPEEAFAVLAKAQETVPLDDPNHLYVPGKVLLMFDKYQDRKKLKEMEKEKEEVTSSIKGRIQWKKSKEDVGGLPEGPPSFCVVTDPITAALRVIEMHKDMVSDHLQDAYIQRVAAVLKQD